MSPSPEKKPKSAVIATGGKQYLVTEGQTIEVELLQLDPDNKAPQFEPLLIIDGDDIAVGAPTVLNTKVSVEVVDANVQADKVTSIRYKAKKRVHTVRGHRQRHTTLRVIKIA